MTAATDHTLTDRQLRFIFEYLKDQNASAAAVRAGYAEKSRASQASELMNNEAVRERIRVEMQGLLAELRCSALALMKERMRGAFFRAEKMFRSGWEPLALDEMEEETRQALEVSTVQRKSGPVVRVRQPDRDKALRALEKVHERLDKLNEQYYAKLEREGRVPSLEEIESMDGGGVEGAVRDIPEKDQVLSGRVAPVEKTAVIFSEIPRVLSGAAGAAEKTVASFSEKHQVLLGSARPMEKTAGLFSKKCQVLSGSAVCAGMQPVVFPLKHMVLSGCGVRPGGASGDVGRGSGGASGGQRMSALV